MMLRFLQGDPNQNCPFVRALTLILSTSNPHVGKAKMRLRGGSVFLEIVNKHLKNVNKFLKNEKTSASQRQFCFTNIGSEIRVIACRKGQF